MGVFNMSKMVGIQGIHRHPKRDPRHPKGPEGPEGPECLQERYEGPRASKLPPTLPFAQPPRAYMPASQPLSESTSRELSSMFLQASVPSLSTHT